MMINDFSLQHWSPFPEVACDNRAVPLTASQQYYFSHYILYFQNITGRRQQMPNTGQ